MRICSFVASCTLIALTAFPGGCNSNEDRKATNKKDAEAEARRKQAEDHYEAQRYAQAIAAYKKYIALEPTGALSDYARKLIGKLSEDGLI
ncbi:MAG: hypothetical protein QGG42_08230 [Phycisphaerae bacterium]|nr:hypothetical protein [Phycisphaerae bacterium]